ncbi:MAG: FtsX-like permease family protein, partial [Spirulina sp. SIO3F2]|nr:FtsX-like permease family protein [Spirulina sp. SIO3F2]
MELGESISMATRTLLNYRLRSLLTMLGMIIGNASVITMVGIGEGARQLAADEFESLGPNTIFVVPGSRRERNTTFDLPKTLVYEDAKAIAEQVPTVSGVAPQINAPQVISYKDRNVNHLVVGTTPDFLAVRDFTMAQGRFFDESDLARNTRVAVIGPETAEQLFAGQSPIGQRIRVDDLSFEVIGQTTEKGAFLGENLDEIVIVPLTTMSNQVVGNTSPYGTQVTFISISARDQQSVSAAEFQIENLLRLRHQITDENDFGVQSQEDILGVVNRVTRGLTAMLAAIAGISLVVGGIGVMNIMLVSVTERTQEIGLRKALGAKEGDILGQFLIEAVIVSAAGGLIGTIVGVSGVGGLALFTPLDAFISPVMIVTAVGVSGGIG